MEIGRSLLFVPGQREEMVAKAPRSGADALVYDLEEAVPDAEKARAREVVGRAVAATAAEGPPAFVRVNHPESGLARDDVLAAVRPGLAGVLLPKAEAAQQVRDLDVLLREAEMTNGVRPGDVAVVVMIESARGVLRCEELARASDRIVALAAGGYDYAADLGVERDREGRALLHLRYVIVQVAAAYGLVPIDTPYGDVADEAGLEAETEFVKAVGFKAKLCVHPKQAAVVNRILSPSAADVAYARRVIEAFDAGVAQGLGAVSLDGRMIDGPVVARARATVALAARQARDAEASG
ncbi:MAG TPA: CoA ester lyase [Dehalococcoidia bacterium]|nr:CoA ester lyase [Dehalococcoidia bacterium]